MPRSTNDLKERLSRYRQIRISVIGRKSGAQFRSRSGSSWKAKSFTSCQQGSDTQWYRNVLKNPSIRIDARGVEAGFRAITVTDATTVKPVVEKFREKYGAKDVKKYYSKFDVAVVMELCGL